MSQMPFPEAYKMNAGFSVCPVCSRHWLVTPADDCLLPACGCFGHDPSHGDRPCEACGLAHALTCEYMPGGRAHVSD